MSHQDDFISDQTYINKYLNKAITTKLLITIFGLAFTAIPLSAQNQTRTDSKPSVLPPRTPQDAVTPVSRNPARHAEFLYRITQGDIGILFLGDSIMDYWPRKGEWSWMKFASYHPANFGIAAERTEHVLWRVLNGELDGIHPKVVVLMVGTNNFGQCPDEQPEWAAAGIARIVETIHEKLPKTKVLLLGLFPRNIAGNGRQKIAATNEIIAKLDDGNKTRYLDVSNVFLNAEGGLSKVMPDLLHPNAKGYDLWYNAMTPLLTEMLR